MKEIRLVKGMIEHLHLDWENKSNLIGTGLLLEKVGQGLPFIISDIDKDGKPIPVGKQKVYTYETWRVKVLTLIGHRDRYEKDKVYNFKFRRNYAVGISPSQSDVEIDINLIRDSFISINGKEIY